MNKEQMMRPARNEQGRHLERAIFYVEVLGQTVMQYTMRTARRQWSRTLFRDGGTKQSSPEKNTHKSLSPRA